MNKRINTGLTLLALLFLFFTTPGIALAQDDNTQWAQYRIQSGDTLYGISIRFNVSVTSIINANDLPNPDVLDVGSLINLPGIAFNGVLTTVDMPFGETLRSYARRFNVTQKEIADLNDLSSPGQLYIGYPLLVSEVQENMEMERAVVSAEMTPLEMAVLTNSNPWKISETNQLKNPQHVVLGDVLFLPGTNQPGPGSLPSPITGIQVTPGAIVQGDTVVVDVSADATFTLEGQLGDYHLHFFPVDQGYVALQGIHAMLEPGFYPFEIKGTFDNGDTFACSQTVKIGDGGFGYETINVDDMTLLDPDLEAEELAFMESYTTHFTPDKYWDGYFTTPSPNDDGYNSVFGTRRSYNGEPYTRYHSGVDFGGGAGLPIYAPAPGEVVFAGESAIRGFLTIIDHGWGVYTAYYHQSEQEVVTGDFVQAGDEIGKVGNTGRSEGAHLHWEVWVGGQLVEPLAWLNNLYP